MYAVITTSSSRRDLLDSVWLSEAQAHARAKEIRRKWEDVKVVGKWESVQFNHLVVDWTPHVNVR
jgi:hypothetical protein